MRMDGTPLRYTLFSPHFTRAVRKFLGRNFKRDDLGA